MTDRNGLTFEYKQNLEKDIIRYPAEVNGISLRDAMERYYQSRLSEEIEEGLYGIENMDSKFLALDLIENEPELFPERKCFEP